jgi:hypothetical protein
MRIYSVLWSRNSHFRDKLILMKKGIHNQNVARGGGEYTEIRGRKTFLPWYSCPGLHPIYTPLLNIIHNYSHFWKLASNRIKIFPNHKINEKSDNRLIDNLFLRYIICINDLLLKTLKNRTFLFNINEKSQSLSQSIDILWKTIIRYQFLLSLK